MDNLQYMKRLCMVNMRNLSFKPYYKWIIFNITNEMTPLERSQIICFKPYYKWIIFNIL